MVLLGLRIQAIFCREIMWCAVRAISCARTRFRGGNLEAPAHFEHGDDVAEGDAFEQPQTGRSNVDGALGIVEGIGLIGTAFGERPG